MERSRFFLYVQSITKGVVMNAASQSSSVVFSALKKRNLKIVSALMMPLFTIGAMLVSGSVAFADTATGVCEGDYCWRITDNIYQGSEVGSQVALWNRDISGDVDQQWTLLPQGSVTSSWPFTNTSLDSTYYGNEVYEIAWYSSTFNQYTCAADAYENLVGTVNCTGIAGVYWVQDGSGHLVNVHQSDVDGDSQDAQAPSDYDQIYVTHVSSSTTKWDFVTVND